MAHRHHRRHRRHRRSSFDGRRTPRSTLLIWGAVAAVLLAAIVGLILLYGRVIAPEEQQVMIEPDPPEDAVAIEHEGRTWRHVDQQYTTILFIGVDQPELSSARLRSGGQADYLMLLTIDRRTHQVHTLQIDRDTMTPVKVYGAFGNPAGTREMQISLSYAFGMTPQKACLNTVDAVEGLLGGIAVDHYVALDMDGMTLLNDALGGVTVTLQEDFSAMDPAMVKGATITLQGRQAEYYLRGRMDVGDGTNAARMNRQAAFMSAAALLIQDRMAHDPGYLVTLLNALDGNLLLSCDEAWLVNQAYAVRQYPRTDVVRLAGENRVGSDGFVEFYPDTNALMNYITSTFCE